jgi:hypothetical protein
MQEIAQEENRIPLPAKASSSLRFLIYGREDEGKPQVYLRTGAGHHWSLVAQTHCIAIIRCGGDRVASKPAPRLRLARGRRGCTTRQFKGAHLDDAKGSATRRQVQRGRRIRSTLASKPGTSHRNRSVAAIAPASCAARNRGTSAGRIPANVSESERAIVTAGFAKEVEEVNQYALLM